MIEEKKSRGLYPAYKPRDFFIKNISNNAKKRQKINVHIFRENVNVFHLLLTRDSLTFNKKLDNMSKCYKKKGEV